MTHNINGAIITTDGVEAIKTIQEYGLDLISPIDTEIENIISNESSEDIRKRLSDLLLIKRLLKGISKVQ